MMDKKMVIPGLSLLVLALVLMGFAGESFAQEGEETASDAEGGDVESRLSQMERLLAQQQKTIEEQKKKLDEIGDEPGSEAGDKSKVEQLEERIDQLEEEQEMASMDSMEGAGEETGLDVHGFFDMGFFKGFYDDDSPYTLFLAPYSSFFVSNVNLYFSSQMTETLGALIEVKLSYMPHGVVNNMQYTARVGETEVPAGGEWSRTDTTVQDPYTTGVFRQGGITLERVHLTYSPADWFNVIAGRFLTPYGIWNIDHGSPVILTVRTPFLQVREMVPRAQTGVQVYGRFFPRYDLFFDYAVTFSNGRGPLDEYMDLDEHKALGLRLGLSYESTDMKMAVGAHGFWGKHSDITQSVVVAMTPEMRVDEDAEKPLLVQTEKSSVYDEYSVATDLLIEVFGFGVQGEFIWRYVDMIEPGMRYGDELLFSGARAVDEIYEASHTGMGAYALIYYKLPFDKFIAPVKITPFFMYEYVASNDTTPYANFDIISGGLNVKPSPFVTLKGEFMRAIPESNMYSEPMDAINFQLAVSF